jgi:hypothetical protein
MHEIGCSHFGDFENLLDGGENAELTLIETVHIVYVSRCF